MVAVDPILPWMRNAVDQALYLSEAPVAPTQAKRRWLGTATGGKPLPWGCSPSLSERSADRGQGCIGIGAVGTPGLSQIGPPAGALATNRGGGGAHQVDRADPAGQVRRYRDDDAGFALGGGHQCHDAGA